MTHNPITKANIIIFLGFPLIRSPLIAISLSTCFASLLPQLVQNKESFSTFELQYGHFSIRLNNALMARKCF